MSLINDAYETISEIRFSKTIVMSKRVAAFFQTTYYNDVATCIAIDPFGYFYNLREGLSITARNHIIQVFLKYDNR